MSPPEASAPSCKMMPPKGSVEMGEDTVKATHRSTLACSSLNLYGLSTAHVARKTWFISSLFVIRVPLFPTFRFCKGPDNRKGKRVPLRDLEDASDAKSPRPIGHTAHTNCRSMLGDTTHDHKNVNPTPTQRNPARLLRSCLSLCAKRFTCGSSCRTAPMKEQPLVKDLIGLNTACSFCGALLRMAQIATSLTQDNEA